MSANSPGANSPLAAHFAHSRTFEALHEAYLQLGFSRELDEIDKEMDGSTDHYFDVGADALRLVVQALTTSGRGAPQTILDFPSGSGRVTRHFTAFFPDADVTTCDLYQSHIDFCTSNFGTTGVIATEHLDEMSFDQQYDVIFCGSLLTHLPAKLTSAAIKLIVESLSPDGVAVMTVHGRQSISIQKNEFEYLDNKRFAKAERGYQSHGYGYVDYEPGFKTKLFSKNSNYGISLTKPSWTMTELEKYDDIRVISYVERGWDRHQDVVMVGRPNHVLP